MKQTLLQEKYPIVVSEIDKVETVCATVGQRRHGVPGARFAPRHLKSPERP